MYKITFYRDETKTLVDFKEFETLESSFEFIGTQPKDNIIEIKYYDNQTRNI